MGVLPILRTPMVSHVVRWCDRHIVSSTFGHAACNDATRHKNGFWDDHELSVKLFGIIDRPSKFLRWFWEIDHTTRNMCQPQDIVLLFYLEKRMVRSGVFAVCTRVYWNDQTSSVCRLGWYTLISCRAWQRGWTCRIHPGVLRHLHLPIQQRVLASRCPWSSSSRAASWTLA